MLICKQNSCKTVALIVLLGLLRVAPKNSPWVSEDALVRENGRKVK